MANKSDLKFYLTSSEPKLLNVTSSQSIGGYPSATPYTISALLSEPMDTQLDSMIVDGVLNGPYAVVVDEEVMKVSETIDLDGDYGASEMLNISRGAFGTNKRFHAEGDLVYAANKGQLFNGSLNDSGKQYRCIAIKNEGTQTFYGLKFYIKNPSKNTKSKVKIALESPSQTIVTGTSTGGTTISLTDTSLINAYADNYFNGRLLVVSGGLNVGQSRVIASFDKRTGIFTFKNSMPYSVAAATGYRIEQSPSQRVISGRVAPSGVTWSTALGVANAVGGADLRPFETIYLWFERDISANTDKYEDNRVIFTAVYKNS